MSTLTAAEVSEGAMKRRYLYRAKGGFPFCRENVARSTFYARFLGLQILYTFVLRAEKRYHISKSGNAFPRVVQKYTKFANFT